MRTRLFTAAAAIALVALFAVQFGAPVNADDHGSDKVKDAPLNTAPEGWTRLFDGESLVGWTIRSGKADYYAQDGAITGTTKKGSPNTFLTTLETYGDFELQFEVFLHDNGLNSGVQIRSKIVNDQGGRYGGRVGGPQVEIEKGPGQSGLVYGEASGGWQSSAEKHKANHKQFKNGQWNHYHIIAKGPRIQTFINGEQVEDLTLKEDYYNRFKEGFIGLQVHSVGGDPNFKVSWRNIYLKELDSE
jgi:hypothetical protein